MPSMPRSHRSLEVYRRRGNIQIMTRLIRALGIAALLLAFGASAESLGPTLQKIKDTGAITIGYRDASVPFSYLDDNQKPIGFSQELCGLVVAKVKAKLGLPSLTV